MDIFKTAEELYDDYRYPYGDSDTAWEKAKDDAAKIVQRQRRDEDRQSDWNSRK